jgi:hypothetical protein
MAQKVCTQEGRPCLLTQTNVQVTSATGHGLSLCGVLEVTVSGIGSATFHVMRDPANHQCIIGWDMLSKYTFRLDTSELSWGTQVYDHVPYQSKSPSTVPIDLPVTSALEKLLEKYESTFGETGKLKEATVAPMEIITTGEPIHQRPYRTPLAKRDAVDKEIDNMLATGVIRPSSSPWASPITLVPKKTGELRFCIDYRKLNSITVKNHYPLPFIRDIHDQLGGATVFSCLDMKSGYHQVPLTPEAIAKTAFVCHRGQYEFTRVPFGLSCTKSLSVHDESSAGQTHW